MRWILPLALVAGTTGCGGEYPGATREDRDGDGLTNAEEAAHQSDPDDPDTDRDGWEDGVEVDSHTSPIDGFDHPYAGGWRIAACRDEVQGTGHAVGQVVPAFSLMDQHGEGVRLHDFCDRVVVVSTAAGWCLPCQQEARPLQTLYERYESVGLMVVTLLGEDGEYGTPNQEDLQAWADGFGLTHPVLQDAGFTQSAKFVSHTNLPTNHVLDRGVVVHTLDHEEITEEIVLEVLGGAR